MSAPTGPRDRRRRFSPLVNLSSNEFFTPQIASVNRLAAGGWPDELLSRYPVTYDHAERTARYLSLGSDELALTPGSDLAIRLICRFSIDHASAGLLRLQDPNYIGWREVAQARGLRLAPAQATLADPVAQAEQLVAGARSGSRELIVVSTPNGLSGGVVPEQMLDELAELAERRGHLVVIDACYQAFAGELTAHLARRGDSVIIVQSLSKSHGLAGARVAVVSAAPERLAQLDLGPLEHAVSAPALVALANAIEHHDVLVRSWVELRARRRDYVARLREWGLQPLPAHGNFIAVRVGEAEDAASLTQALSLAGYRVRDLSALPGLAGCIRFTVADEETMERFLSALKGILR